MYPLRMLHPASSIANVVYGIAPRVEAHYNQHLKKRFGWKGLNYS